jgi:hypothetical protein
MLIDGVILASSVLLAPYKESEDAVIVSVSSIDEVSNKNNELDT